MLLDCIKHKVARKLLNQVLKKKILLMQQTLQNTLGSQILKIKNKFGEKLSGLMAATMKANGLTTCLMGLEKSLMHKQKPTKLVFGLTISYTAMVKNIPQAAKFILANFQKVKNMAWEVLRKKMALLTSDNSRTTLIVEQEKNTSKTELILSVIGKLEQTTKNLLMVSSHSQPVIKLSFN